MRHWAAVGGFGHLFTYIATAAQKTAQRRASEKIGTSHEKIDEPKSAAYCRHLQVSPVTGIYSGVPLPTTHSSLLP